MKILILIIKYIYIPSVESSSNLSDVAIPFNDVLNTWALHEECILPVCCNDPVNAFVIASHKDIRIICFDKIKLELSVEMNKGINTEVIEV